MRETERKTDKYDRCKGIVWHLLSTAVDAGMPHDEIDGLGYCMYQYVDFAQMENIESLLEMIDNELNENHSDREKLGFIVKSVCCCLEQSGMMNSASIAYRLLGFYFGLNDQAISDLLNGISDIIDTETDQYSLDMIQEILATSLRST